MNATSGNVVPPPLPYENRGASVAAKVSAALVVLACVVAAAIFALRSNDPVTAQPTEPENVTRARQLLERIRIGGEQLALNKTNADDHSGAKDSAKELDGVVAATMKEFANCLAEIRDDAPGKNDPDALIALAAWENTLASAKRTLTLAEETAKQAATLKHPPAGFQASASNGVLESHKNLLWAQLNVSLARAIVGKEPVD